MVLKILEESIDEPIEPAHAPIAIRLFGCAVACLVALIPALATGYSASRLTSFLRGMKNAESVPSAMMIVSNIRSFNEPLIIGLAVSALFALAFGVLLAVNPQFRLASVGVPCSIGTLFMAAGPALFLWGAEARVMDMVYNKISNQADVAETASTVSLLIFGAMLTSVLTVPASIVTPLVSLLVSMQSRWQGLSPHRAMIWFIGGVLLLSFAGVYLLLG
jgi:hypothetical protein